MKQLAVAGDVRGDLVPALLPQQKKHSVAARLVVLDQSVERAIEVIGIGVAFGKHRRASGLGGLLEQSLPTAELPQDRLHRDTRALCNKWEGDGRDRLLGREFDRRTDDANLESAPHLLREHASDTCGVWGRVARSSQRFLMRASTNSFRVSAR